MATLPSTAAELEAIRRQLESLIAAGRELELVDLVMSVVSTLKEENDRLGLRLARLLADKFGRRSEKVSSAQLALFLAQLGTAGEPESQDPPRDEAAPPPSENAPAPARRRPTRQRLPQHLPREVVELDVDPKERVCPVCGGEKRPIGHETSEMLEWVPGHFKVIEFRRQKHARAHCAGEVSIAPAAAKPIDGGIPGPGLLADVIVRKYVDHAPLHRIRRIYARHGVDLAVSTLVGWVAAVTDDVRPVYRLIRARALIAHDLKVDDTPLRVLDRSKAGGSKRGHM
jgi:transposase